MVTTGIVFLVLIVLMLLSVPIAFSVALAAILGFYLTDQGSLFLFVQNMFSGIDSFTLIAIPLFILTGNLMAIGGVTRDLLEFSRVFVGTLRGGLAYINILASMFFAGITGSATADAASIGSIMIPAMEKKGYDKDFSVAVTASSSTIGTMIPPSIPMVVFGVSAGVSVGKLFIGGIVPGILVALVLMFVTYIIARKRNYPVEEPLTWKESGTKLLKGIPALMTVIVLIGGIISGIFTATEAAAIAVVYTFLLGTLYYRQLKLKHMPKIILDTAITTGMVTIMISTASALGNLLTIERVPLAIGDFILSITTSKTLILLLILLILLIVGAFMDLSPAVIIFTPILMPIVIPLGVDPVHFGVIMIVVLAIGLFTPPVGVVLFVTSGIAGLPITGSIKAITPYLLAMLVVVLLITFIPQLVMFLPNLLME